MSIETLFRQISAFNFARGHLRVSRVSLDEKGRRDTARSLVETYLLLNSRETLTMNQRMRLGYYSPYLTLALS